MRAKERIWAAEIAATLKGNTQEYMATKPQEDREVNANEEKKFNGDGTEHNAPMTDGKAEARELDRLIKTHEIQKPTVGGEDHQMTDESAGASANIEMKTFRPKNQKSLDNYYAMSSMPLETAESTYYDE
jgi:hypothetical protein